MEVVHTDEFGGWWDALSEDEQEDVARVIELLRCAGALLKFPHSSALHGTNQPLRELRPRQGASPLPLSHRCGNESPALSELLLFVRSERLAESIAGAR